MPEGVSIIICCHNSESRIIHTLQALQKQEFSKRKINWEVILVDNASTDKTQETARETWNNNPVTDLKIVKEDKPGLMYARKRGLEAATFDIVSFIDDDNWIEPYWIGKVMEVFLSDEMIGACGGRSEAVFEKTKPHWFDQYQSSFAVGTQADVSGIIDDKKGYLWGAGLSIRRSIWTELQQRGFVSSTVGREGKNITAGEDSELCYAIRLLGYHLYYRDDLLLKHFMTDSRMNQYYLEKMYEGFGKAYARLNSYRVLLYKKTFKLYPWWYEWLSAKRRIFFSEFRKIFIRDEYLKQRLMLGISYNKGYSAQVWSDRLLAKRKIVELKNIFRK